MSAVLTIDRYALRNFFGRWSAFEDEKDRLGEQLLEFFEEARKAGFEPKTMRAAFRLKRAADADPDTAIAENEAVRRYLAALNVTAERLASRVAREEDTPPEPKISTIKERARAIMNAAAAAKRNGHAADEEIPQFLRRA